MTQESTIDMTADNLVLLILHHAGGNIMGKTLLQKRAFFVSEVLGLDLRFKAHFYGPFSPEVENALSQEKSLGFIQEQAYGFGETSEQGFEKRRHDFFLTEDGKKLSHFYKKKAPVECNKVIECLDRLSKENAFFDYFSLSIAAKTYFILKQTNAAMTIEEIKIKAGQLGWTISSPEVEGASTFLQNAGLIRA